MGGSNEKPKHSTAHRAVATSLTVKKTYGRRPLRLTRVFDPSSLYFITFNTHDRIRFLVSDKVHSAFVGFAQRAERDFNVAVGRYVIMPDHIHLFVRGGANFSLGPGSVC